MECLAIYAMFVGLVIGGLVVYGLALLRKKMQTPVLPDEPPPTPVFKDDR